jgi:hypothetical protein
MTDEEKIALKPACVQAAAVMMAAREGPGSTNAANAEECARLAALLCAEAVALDWRAPTT